MFRRGLLGYLPVNLLQAAAGFGSIALFTRLLSPTAYGDYALAFSTCSLVYLVGLTWIEAAMARFYPAEGTVEGVEALYATLYRSFAGTVLIVPLLGGAILLWAPLSRDLKLAIAAGLAASIVRSLLKLAQERRRAAGEVRAFALFDMVQTAGGFALGAGLAALGLGAAAPLAGAGLASAVLLAFVLPGEVSLARRGRFDPQRFTRSAAYGLPLALSLMMSLALASTDRFVLAGDLNAKAVGAYHAGYTLSNRTLDILFLWLGMAGQPACVAALERGGRAALRETARAQGALMILIAVPAAAGLMVVSGPLARLMVGPGLAATAAGVTPWIALSALFSGLTTHYFNTAFTLARRTRRLFAAISLPAALNLALALALVPRFGLMGAVASTVVSYALGLIASIALCPREVALPIPWGDLVKSVFGAAVMVLAALAVPTSGDLETLMTRTVVGAAVYAGVAIALDAGGARSRARQAFSAWRETRTAPLPWGGA